MCQLVMVEGWWIVRGGKKKPSSTFQCPVEEAQLNIHQTMTGSGRRCLLSFLGEFLLCRGEVSTFPGGDHGRVVCWKKILRSIIKYLVINLWLNCFGRM